jgi:hypothetical protein
MTARVHVAPDAQWFRVALTVPADIVAGTDLLDQLAAAFAEDPVRIAAQLLALHELNGQVAADVEAGHEHSAEHASGHADLVRNALAEDLPLDVTVRLDEQEARDLSSAALTSARRVFSARGAAGYDPARKATPLRSVA